AAQGREHLLGAADLFLQDRRQAFHAAHSNPYALAAFYLSSRSRAASLAATRSASTRYSPDAIASLIERTRSASTSGRLRICSSRRCSSNADGVSSTLSADDAAVLALAEPDFAASCARAASARRVAPVSVGRGPKPAIRSVISCSGAEALGSLSAA